MRILFIFYIYARYDFVLFLFIFKCMKVSLNKVLNGPKLVLILIYLFIYNKFVFILDIKSTHTVDCDMTLHSKKNCEQISIKARITNNNFLHAKL